MFASAFFAALHFLALGLGFAGVWTRGVGLRSAARDPAAVATVLQGDTLWGVAALLWLGTGLARAFGGLEKGGDWYLHQPAFWLKIGLFATVFLLELWPMATFIRWRVHRAKGREVDLAAIPALLRINTAEMVLTALIPFVAVAMARGMGG